MLGPHLPTKLFLLLHFRQAYGVRWSEIAGFSEAIPKSSVSCRCRQPLNLATDSTGGYPTEVIVGVIAQVCLKVGCVVVPKVSGRMGECMICHVDLAFKYEVTSVSMDPFSYRAPTGPVQHEAFSYREKGIAA